MLSILLVFLLHHQVLHLTSSSLTTPSVDIPGPPGGPHPCLLGGDSSDSGGGGDQPSSTEQRSRVLQAEVPHVTTPSLLLSVLCHPVLHRMMVCLCSIVISKVCRTLPHAQYEPHLQKHLSYSYTVISWFLVPFAHCTLQSLTCM